MSTAPCLPLPLFLPVRPVPVTPGPLPVPVAVSRPDLTGVDRTLCACGQPGGQFGGARLCGKCLTLVTNQNRSNERNAR